MQYTPSGFGYISASGLHPLNICGAVPLTIRNALARKLMSLTIHGNTVEGIAVGDKTDNRFSMSEFAAKLKATSSPVYQGTCSITDDKITITSSAAICFTRTWEAKDNPYRISVLPNTQYILTWKAVTESEAFNDVFVFVNGSTANGYLFFAAAKAGKLTFTTPSDASFVYLRLGAHAAGNSVTYSEIQFNTASEYEPYGYKLPLSIATEHDNTLLNLYTDEPLYAGDIFAIPPELLPQIFSGNNVISVNTIIPPSQIDVKYMR